MSKTDIFEGFSEEKQKAYAEEARQRWDPILVDHSQKRWGGYSDEKKKAIMAEAGEIYQKIFANSDKGPDSQKVQDLIGQWHQNLRYFYEPTHDILRGLGQIYCDDPRFRANFTKLSPEFPEFLRASIDLYCDRAQE